MMMKKNILIMAVIVLVIGVALFHEQVGALLRGMTPLESLKFIFNFVLHAAVVTIVSYIAYSLPEIVKPFFNMLRRNRRAARRHRSQAKPAVARSPKLTTDMLLREYMLKQALPKARPSEPAAQPSEDIHLNF